jgi:hypothetical protein
VALGEVCVGTRYDAHTLPKILAALVLGPVVIPEALRCIIRFANVDLCPDAVTGIRANEKVHPRTGQFLALDQFGKLTSSSS